MATPVYPATNNSEAIELNISNANQFFTILQGGVDDFILTYEDNLEIPSVAKALHEAAAYKGPLAWQTTGEETDLLQTRVFNGAVYAPLEVPAPFAASPDSNFWRVLQTNVVKSHIDATTDPAVTNDSSEGYSINSLWINQSTSEVFRCLDATEGAAVWVKTTLTIDELGALAVGDDASDVPYDTTGSVYSATTVKGALDQNGTAALRDVGSGSEDIPDNAELNTRLNTTGNLPTFGTAASEDTGTLNSEIPTNADLLRQVSVDVSSGATLTESDSTADLINLTGTLTADVALIVPDAARKYTIVNSTSGAFTVTVKTASGAGEEVIRGNATILRSDGTDVVSLSPVGAYSAKDIGEPFGIWDHLTGVEPPDNSGAAKFVRLTAGEDGPGGYNEGLLANETVIAETSAGAGPTITAEIVVGPNAGDVINLLNSENRYLMPGDVSGAVADDQMQQILGGIGGGTRSLFWTPEARGASGAFQLKPGTALNSSSGSGSSTNEGVDFDSANSPDARTGTKTNVKHAQATYYMRIA